MAYDQIIKVTRTFSPVMEQVGIPTVEEVDSETLPDRMRDEAVALDAMLIAPLYTDAWTRKA